MNLSDQREGCTSSGETSIGATIGINHLAKACKAVALILLR